MPDLAILSESISGAPDSVHEELTFTGLVSPVNGLEVPADKRHVPSAAITANPDFTMSNRTTRGFPSRESVYIGLRTLGPTALEDGWTGFEGWRRRLLFFAELVWRLSAESDNCLVAMRRSLLEVSAESDDNGFRVTP